MLGWHICLYGENEARLGKQVTIALSNLGDAHATAPILEREWDRGLHEHRTQRLMQLRDYRREGPFEVIMAVERESRGALALIGEGCELAGHLKRQRIHPFGMGAGPPGEMGD